MSRTAPLASPSPPSAPSPLRRDAGRLARGCVLALLLAPTLALLGGCLAESTAQAANAATGMRDEKLARDLEKLERSGQARPTEHEVTLAALLARTAPGSPERVEVLSLAGNLAALGHDRAKVDSISQQLNDWPAGPARADALLALAYVQGQFHRAKGDVREAKKALAGIDAEAFRDAAPLAKLRALGMRALVKGDAGEMDEAIANSHQALRIAQQLGSSWRLAYAHNELALIYWTAEQMERARQTQAEAQREAEQDPDPFMMTRIWSVRGIIYSDDLDTSITLQASAKAIEAAEAAGADSVRAQALANYADYHLRQRKYARALQLAEEALPLARKTRNLNAEIVSRLNIGLAKIATNRVAEGRIDARAAITLDEQQGATSWAAKSWQELGEYLERANDYAGAIEAHHEYRRLNDQVLRDDTRKAVLEAQERYDAEQRSKEIELLNRDNSLMSERIRARDLELQLWAALGGCIVISALLMGLFYQRVRKTNEALAHSNAKLKIQSERDPLTGLANRRHFQAAIKELAAEGKLSGTVFLIDIDHFKRINDVHGHAAGDTVLIEVAQRLNSALREDDLVVRWGGEEFLIVVKAREAAFAQGLAQRLLDLIALPAVRHGSQVIPITASIGFASFPVEPHGLALNWERAIDLVDTVMYMAKAHGRNKAYGIEQIEAADEAALALIATRMEAACHEGLVKLVALQGPVAMEEARA